MRKRKGEESELSERVASVDVREPSRVRKFRGGDTGTKGLWACGRKKKHKTAQKSAGAKEKTNEAGEPWG